MKYFLNWAITKQPTLVTVLLLSFFINIISIIIAPSIGWLQLTPGAIWIVAMFFARRCYVWDKRTAQYNTMIEKYKVGP